VRELGGGITNQSALPWQVELESDYEMGVALQERVVPHAIKWFTGEAEDDDDDEYMDEEDEEVQRAAPCARACGKHVRPACRGAA
jgi:hypothetical protein